MGQIGSWLCRSRLLLLIPTAVMLNACSPGHNPFSEGELTGASIAESRSQLSDVDAKTLTADSGYAMVMSLFNNLCLEFKDGNLVQDTCSQSNDQQVFPFTSSGNYQLISVPGL